MEQLEPAFDYSSPIVECIFPSGSLDLTHFNTTICLYEDPQFNHIEYIDPEGIHWGYIVTQEQLDLLFNANFPMFSLPFVDASTLKWFESIELADLEDSPPELG